MTGLLFLLLDTMRRHRAACAWLLAAVASAVVMTGAVIGAGTRPEPVYAETSAALQRAETAPVATVAARTTSLRGVVVAVRQRRLLLLTEDGHTVAVQLPANMVLRRAGQAVAESQLHRGQKVIILGRTQPGGALRARSIAIRGEVRIPPPQTRTSAAPAP